jgi:xanthine dehydrogenase/oxidase
LYIIPDEKYLAFVMSQKAHAKILSVDSSEAVTLPGVVDFISYKDIPGQNMWGGAVSDEEIFASEKVSVQQKFSSN